MAEPTTANNQEASGSDVLTLHRGVLARWADGSIGQASRATRQIGDTVSGLIPHLAGLSVLPSSFGVDAFQIATLLASQPRLSSSLGPMMRSMPVGDLADLVQVVLEEEEAALEEAVASLGRSRLSRGRSAREVVAAWLVCWTLPTRALGSKRPKVAAAVVSARRVCSASRRPSAGATSEVSTDPPPTAAEGSTDPMGAGTADLLSPLATACCACSWAAWARTACRARRTSARRRA